MDKKVLVAIGDGFEEIEAMTIIDVLRRAGADVTVASVQEKQVTAAHGVIVIADRLIGECSNDEFDLVALPGGMPGATNLKNSEALKQILLKQNQKGQPVAAICASPAVVLQSHGILDNRQATCYPSFSKDLGSSYTSSSTVVTDSNCITSQGPGTAMAFALKLVDTLYGSETVDELKQAMLIS